MRKGFTYHVVGLLCLLALSASAQQVKVMQWNVHGTLGNIASNNTAAAQALTRVVKYNQPDIITFNELEDVGASDADIGPNTASMIDYVTNNLPYFGNTAGVTFWVNMATVSDGFLRNGSISRYPISGAFTYSDAGTLGGTNYANLRGMESFQVQLAGTNQLEVFHVHLKCCSTYPSCPRRQSEANTDATNIATWAASHSFPYILTGDLNEDENAASPLCTINSAYHPITTLKQGGGLLEYLPKTLTGGTLTWNATSPSIRFDYVLPATNRISLTPSTTAVCITTGIVFNSSVWGSQYTSVIPGSSTLDSRNASDHLCVQVTFRFPTSATNFNVTPATTFASSGSPGGPFSPASQVYTLTNSDTIPLFWSITKTSNWLTVSTLATNLTLGAGKSTNITAFITNSVANALSAGTYVDTINFSNTATGVSLPRNVTLTIGTSPPSANFAGNPTNGVEPLLVNFSDTSTGSISNRFWNFGDSTTTNLTTNGVSHTYAAGTYDVTLIVTGSGGGSTNAKPGYISVLTTFQSWQIQYFSTTNNPSAASDADPDGDGCTNFCEFMTGSNPTNSASLFRITSVAAQGDNVLITWTTTGGRTNVVQATDGGYTTNFTDLSSNIIISSGDTATNYLDAGGATNDPTHFYRIRLQP